MKQKNNILTIIWAISVILAATFWSLDGVLIRPKFYSFSVINIVFIEHFLWAIILSPFLILWYKKLKTISKKNILSLMWVCVFWWLIWTLAITKAFFSAYEEKEILSTVVILQKLQPIFALFLARIILKEKQSLWFYSWATVVLLSAYLMVFWAFWKDIFNINLFKIPAFYAILAAFAFGSSTVFWKDLVDSLWFKLTSSLRFTITCVLALIVLLIFGNFEPFWEIFNLNTNIVVFGLGLNIKSIILIAFIESWAIFLYYFGMKKISASATTIFELAWPLSAIFFEYKFYWHTLNQTQIIASIVLLISFFMITQKPKF